MKQEIPAPPASIEPVMTQREFDELSLFLDNVTRAKASARILAITNASKYGAMAHYVEQLHADIKMHHEANEPFFTEQEKVN